MTRFDDRKARTRERRQALFRLHTYRVAWSVACLLLLLTFGGMWVYAQSLESKATALQAELHIAQQHRPAASTTCKVDSSWLPNTTRTMVVNGRSYLVHTPQAFDPQTYYPLLIFYPGKGASALTAELTFHLNTLPGIIAYPYPTPGTDGALAWQGAPYSSRSNDVMFTAKILDELQAALCVDKTRIYAVGFSNGGAFASLLSCTLPDRFAAYAVISGAMYAPSGQCKPPKPTPLLNIHGDNDPVVPYGGSSIRRLPSIDTWVDTRAEFNGCTAPTTAGSDFGQAITTWNDCKNGATVQNIRVVGGGHRWGMVSNEYLWQFLSRFSL